MFNEKVVDTRRDAITKYALHTILSQLQHVQTEIAINNAGNSVR